MILEINFWEKCLKYPKLVRLIRGANQELIFSKLVHQETSTNITQWQLVQNVNQLRHILRRILNHSQLLIEIPS